MLGGYIFLPERLRNVIFVLYNNTYYYQWIWLHARAWLAASGDFYKTIFSILRTRSEKTISINNKKKYFHPATMKTLSSFP